MVPTRIMTMPPRRAARRAPLLLRVPEPPPAPRTKRVTEAGKSCRRTPRYRALLQDFPPLPPAPRCRPRRRRVLVVGGRISVVAAAAHGSGAPQAVPPLIVVL
jgi:hypothetical protein